MGRIVVKVAQAQEIDYLSGPANQKQPFIEFVVTAGCVLLKEDAIFDAHAEKILKIQNYWRKRLLLVCQKISKV